MRIGFQGSGQLPSALPAPSRYRAVAELVEELGYDPLWAGEHLSFQNPILDLGGAFATFAAVPPRIVLGAGVVLLPLRHPGLVAKQAASLDYVSGGRLLLGLGVGGEGPCDFEAAGVPIAERGRRADEGIVSLRVLLRDRPASFAGRYPGAFHRVVVLFAHVDEDGERARAEAIAHLSERYGMRFERHHVERLCVVGTPEECRARIGAYREAGPEHLSFNPAVGERGFLEQVRRIRSLAPVGAAA